MSRPFALIRPNGNKMSIGWRQFDSVSSNFRQAGFAYTTNGGRNWISPGVLQPNVFRSDPVLNSDNTGRFFYLSLLQTFFDDLWRSLTGGQSWTNIAPADGGDKQWFTIDNTNSSGHGFQYQFWSTDGNNYGGRQFTRSVNGGFDLDESDQHSELPCLGHTGRRFQWQPFHWRREPEHWRDLVYSLHQCKERRCHSNLRPNQLR